ncbi:DUF3825 domain-containing protein [Thermophilibacter provencensis]|uniref:DUF3825 domain-containing protein n=1 Tax=Thermophilibacter provencensis TaxID=1852386 RepID=UPI00294350D5|nr:DUF3825 domain-containing protein [Thermophilibacter provencensis]
MAKITPGNRVYLYQLLSRELGVNRQTLLPRAEEALVADGLAPADLGCADMRELCEQLPEFIKLTVFKKGYVYATVLACEEYDRALERTQDAGDKAAASGKPWKRKRGAKALKPVRPRHIEPPAKKDEKDEKDGDAVVEAVVPDGTEAAGGAAPAEVAAHEGEPTSSVGEAPEAAPEPEAEAAPEPGAAHAEEGPAEVAPSDVAPSGEEASGTDVDGPGAPVEPGHEPPISFTITYVPEAPSPDAIALPDVAPRVRSDLPRDFHADIRCSDEQLSLLYQVLPPNVDPLTVLEEDFRAARSTGALEGTRSNVSFALRYLQADGATPVRVTLRRSVRPVAGKRWALTEVEAGAAEEVGLEGLSAAARGPWSAFAEAAPDGVDPLRALTSTVALGPWDEALSALAALAAPEPWGEGLAVLRDCLTMTVARIVSEGKVAVSPDGAAASFDTGLLTGDGAPIYALLSPLEGDIPWQLAEFSTAGAGEPALYLTALAEAAFDRSVPAPDFSGAALVMRCPRAATPAYDPVSDRTVLLVPDGGSALALLPTESGYERIATLSLSDGYACARVVSAELPAWLRG